MRLRPLNDNIIIEPDEEKKYEGILSIPDTVEAAYKKVAPTGTIVSWGDRCKYKELYKVGKKIYFRQFSGTNIKFKDSNLRVITELDLIGLCENER